MKFFLPRLTLWFLVLFAFGTMLSAAPVEKEDPLVGKWIWHHKITVVIRADGTATSDASPNGTWTYNHNPEVQRKYRISWEHGKYIDNLVLSEDGQKGLLLTDSGKYEVHRATD